MSFILDALKKSETDRQQTSSPGIADVPTASSPPPTPAGIWVLVGVLATLVVVLLGVLLKPASDRTPTVAAEPPAPADAAPTQVAMAAAPAAEPVRAATAAPRTERRPEAEPAPPPTQRDPAPVEQRAAAPVETTPEPVVAPPPAETETFLTFNDLRASGNLSLPDLHIDLHVYSDNPTERFVFINMNQYRENSTLSEGPRLRQITSEGVVLEYLGTTFLLPRE